MPRGPEKPSEFHRYRQVLAALYLGTISAGVVLLAASVVKELWFRPAVELAGPVLDAETPDPADLLRCNDDVAALQDELARTALALLVQPTAPPGSSDSAAPPASSIRPAWEQFSRNWLTRWDEVDAWCRFSELAGDHMGDAYNRMAEIHADLRAVRLKYQGLLVRFDDELADELADMRRGLALSRRTLEASAGTRQEQAQ